jgi:xylan 1,4-beta-xylosidase
MATLPFEENPPVKYQNPIIPGFHPDPSVCRVGEDYFLVTSSFEFFPGVPLFHSRDLIHWQQIGHCLTRESQLPLHNANCSAGIFAPTIRHHQGRFYMVTTNVSKGGNFFVWTDDPYGEWSEPVWLDQRGIDPSLLFDDDGKVYLTTHDNQQSEIDIKTGEIRSPIQRTWEGTGGGHMEAPHLYRIGDFYYLMVAEGGTARGHMINIARSRSPWGPFEPCPHNPILSNRGRGGNPVQATGHCDLVEAHDGSWWVVFLAIRETPGPSPRVHHLGRETFLAPVTWDEKGWPVINSHEMITTEMEANCLPVVLVPALPIRDDFDSPQWPLHWNHIRNPVKEHYSLSERAGWLCLQTPPTTLNDKASPAFIGRRQQHVCCQVTTLLDVSPTGTEEAGLTVLMNNRHHYEIAVRCEAGERQVFLRRTIGSLHLVEASQPLPAGGVQLRIEADQAQYRFAFATADGDWQEIGTGETRYLSTEVAGGFTGVYLGLYATGNGLAGNANAYLDYFDYKATHPQEA